MKSLDQIQRLIAEKEAELERLHLQARELARLHAEGLGRQEATAPKLRCPAGITIRFNR
ncbi:MAG: hypothetical protein P8011_06080 [Acidihalobacter sp.]|uniref:hypothetical protein n=1 Tax=Acidihalobacter sp. TaxID=1872108 RepID=UPI00307F3A3A